MRDMVTSVYRGFFWLNFPKNIIKVCFKHYQISLKTYLITHLIKITVQKKNTLRQLQFFLKRGGVRRGMIMITDSIAFFRRLFYVDSVRLWWPGSSCRNGNMPFFMVKFENTGFCIIARYFRIRLSC